MMGLLRPSGGRFASWGSASGGARYAAREDRLFAGEFRIWGRPKAKRSLSVLAALGTDRGAAAQRKALAERLELDLDRPVGDLSKGNRQKVAVISAFQHQPDALILDEPTAGLTRSCDRPCWT